MSFTPLRQKALKGNVSEKEESFENTQSYWIFFINTLISDELFIYYQNGLWFFFI